MHGKTDRPGQGRGARVVSPPAVVLVGTAASERRGAVPGAGGARRSGSAASVSIASRGARGDGCLPLPLALALASHRPLALSAAVCCCPEHSWQGLSYSASDEVKYRCF